MNIEDIKWGLAFGRIKEKSDRVKVKGKNVTKKTENISDKKKVTGENLTRN